MEKEENAKAPYRHGGMAGKKFLHDFSVNVNPQGPPPGVVEAVRAAASEIYRYPDPGMLRLRQEIIQAETKRSGANLSMEDVVPGNGASELITACIRTLSPERSLLQIPNFYGYERGLMPFAKDVLPCLPEQGFHLPEDTPARIRSVSPALVCLCNPANPTGVTLPQALLFEISAACEETGSFLLVDECFIEFLPDYPARTLAPLLKTHPHLLLLRAFTKLYAMPGLRLGYAYMGTAWKALGIEEALPEWNISTVAEAAGLAALKEDPYFERTAALTAEQRAFLSCGLSEIFPKTSLSIMGGDANFLFVRMEDRFYEALLRRGFLLRKCDNYRGLPKNGYYRIAVKQREENAALLDAFQKIRDADPECGSGILI